jgi:hypothetical protein
MSDLAPWESGDRKQPFNPEAPTEKVPKRGGGRLPEIYKRQTEAFIAPPGNVVPRPPLKPRPLEPRARFALYGLAGAIAIGLGWAALTFVIFNEAAGALRFIYAALGVVLAVVALAIILAS